MTAAFVVTIELDSLLDLDIYAEEITEALEDAGLQPLSVNPWDRAGQETPPPTNTLGVMPG